MAKTRKGGTNINDGYMNAGDSRFMSSTNLRRGVMKTGWKHERDFGPFQPSPSTGVRGPDMGAMPKARVSLNDLHRQMEHRAKLQMGRITGSRSGGSGGRGSSSSGGSQSGGSPGA